MAKIETNKWGILLSICLLRSPDLMQFDVLLWTYFKTNRYGHNGLRVNLDKLTMANNCSCWNSNSKDVQMYQALKQLLAWRGRPQKVMVSVINACQHGLWEWGGTGAFILARGTRVKWMVSLTPSTAVRWGERAGWTPEPLWTCWRTESLVLLATALRFLGGPIHSLVLLSTDCCHSCQLQNWTAWSGHKL